MVQAAGDEGLGGAVGFLCPPACLSCYSSLLSFLSQAPPFFRIRKVFFYGGKTSPSLF